VICDSKDKVRVGATQDGRVTQAQRLTTEVGAERHGVPERNKVSNMSGEVYLLADVS